jgi:arginine/ornithine transport system substrate-binding protein
LDGTVADVIEVKGGFLDTPDGKDYVFVGKTLGSFVNYFGKGAGIAVRKQDKDLRTALDNGIKTLRKNGEWQKISDKYFAGTDIWGD